MAGHSKWANIKHKKAAQDAKRGKAFTRLSKEISVAARLGGNDLTANARLRQLVDKARGINMPMDTVNRAIKKGTGEIPGMQYEEHVYEGYGPHGIAFIVETLTDNKNRTVADMRRLFTKSGGSLAETGAVGWMFEKLGVIRAENNRTMTEDKLLEKLIDFDIKDISKDDDLFVITTDPKSLDAVKQEIENAGLKIESADLEFVPKNPTELEENKVKQAINFMDELEEHEDVQKVYPHLS
jgi:YebC/PmpR family DNA-binding regulatory protein